MRLKLFHAASMADAMAQLRSELGPEALIVSTRRVGDGIELTAAIEPADEPPQRAPVGLPTLSPVAPPTLAAERLPGPGAATRLDAAYHGIPAVLAARLAGDDLAGCLAATLRFAALPLQAGARLLLAGTPGAGKTLCVARLATRLVLAGIRPLVVTADGRRAGGAEELAAYTRLLGLTLLAASTPATLARALADAAPDTPILIDSAGINPFEPADIAELSGLIAAARAAPILVMSAGAHPEEAAEQAACFAALGVAHMLPTRLDIARRLGGILAAADPAGPGLILTEAGIGTGATDGLASLTPALLAGRLLRHQPARPRLRQPIFPPARPPAADAWMHPHG